MEKNFFRVFTAIFAQKLKKKKKREIKKKKYFSGEHNAHGFINARGGFETNNLINMA
jgi:hypothetical protein